MSPLCLFLALAAAYDSVITTTQTQSGTCYLIGSAISAFQLPSSPLLVLEAYLYIGRLSQPLSEYPPLRPILYTRFDAYASAQAYDHSRAVEQGWTMVLLEFIPPAANWLYFRLDGGLNDGLFMQSARMLHNWFYYLEVTYTYCPAPAFYLSLLPQGWFNTPLICDSAVDLTGMGEAKLTKAQVIPVQVTIEALTGWMNINMQYIGLGDVEIVVSPDNFLNVPSVLLSNYTGEVYFWTVKNTGSFQIPTPRPGPWYLVLRVLQPGSLIYSISTTPCYLNSTQALCGGAPTALVPYIQYFTSFTPTDISLLNTVSLSPKSSQVLFAFTAQLLDQGRHYGLHIYFTRPTDQLQTDFEAMILQGIKAQVSRGSPAFPFLTLFNCHQGVNPCKAWSDNKGVGLFLYPAQTYSGLLYLSVSLSSLLVPVSVSVGVGVSDCGQDMCHGDQCSDIKNAPAPTKWCQCLRNHSGLSCQELAFSNVKYVFWVLFLVCSNMAMLPALYFAIFIYRKYPEALIFGCTMLTSGLYHLCDTEYYCFNLSVSGLRLCDFYVSYFSITTSIIYLARLQRMDLKAAFIILYALLLLYCGALTFFDGIWSQVIIPFTSALVPLGSWVWFIAATSREFNSRCWCWRLVPRFLFRSGNFRWKFGIPAAFSFAIALTCSALESNYNYWIVTFTQTHSLWHVFVMLTPCFVLLVFPSNRDKFQLEVKREVPESELILTANH
jgi:hypothetical protein